MQYNKFGRTGLEVSELCLGALQFGWLSNASEAFRLLDSFREGGGNFIQAATVASSENLLTQPEETLGKWLRQRSMEREKLVLATRILFPSQCPTKRKSIAGLVRDSCEASLRRLGTSHLDLLVCEWGDALQPVNGSVRPIDELLTGLEHLTQAGKIRYAVTSGFPNWRVMEALSRADRLRGCRFEAIQQKFSLLDQENFRTEMRPMVQEYRLGVIAQSPLASGFLTGKYGRSTGLHVSPRARHLSMRYANERNFNVLHELSEISHELHTTPAQVALKWVLHHKFITSTVIGCQHSKHIQSSLEATHLNLTDNHLDRLAHAGRSANSQSKLLVS